MDGWAASVSMSRALHAPAVDATLRTVTALTGMEMAFVAAVDASQLTFTRVQGAPGSHAWPGVAEGGTLPRLDSLCDTVLRTGAFASSDIGADPVLGPIGVRNGLGMRSYVGVPVRDPAGEVYGTLCAADRDGVPLGDRALDGLVELAGIVTARLSETAPALVRGPDGWRVTGMSGDEAEAEDLLSGMVLADLLAAELGEHPVIGRPPRGDAPADELGRLRLSVTQLEHALAARVVVEQAIGVLSERRRVPPRSAFELLRGVARGSGRRVHDLAHDVVASALPGGRGITLPAPLVRPGGAPSPALVAQAVRTHGNGHAPAPSPVTRPAV